MRKLLIALAAVAAAAIAVTVAVGSSHREAPLTSLDPTADDTDVYAFTAKDAPGSLTVVAQLDPVRGSRPAARTSTGSTTAPAYYINIDNTGDGKCDIRYRFKFKTKVRNPDSFLYALPGASGYDDPKLNVVADVLDHAREPRTSRQAERTSTRSTIARDLPVAPTNVGPKTFPNYEAFVDGAISSLERRQQGVRRPARRSVLRRPRRDLRRDQHPQSSPATRAGARTTSPASTSTDRPAGPGAAVTRTARPSPAPTRPTRSSASGRPTEPQAARRSPTATRRSARPRRASG